MSFKRILLAGAMTFSGFMFLHTPSAFAADTKAPAAANAKAAAEMPKYEQRAVDKAQPDRVAAQVQELHDKLKITPAQEKLWEEVADAMQDTAKEVRTKLAERSEKGTSERLTAVEELRAYTNLQQVQYDGARRLMSPFEKLYDSMSADQKKNADEVFEHPHEEAEATGGGGEHHHHHDHDEKSQ